MCSTRPMDGKGDPRLDDGHAAVPAKLDTRCSRLRPTVMDDDRRGAWKPFLQSPLDRERHRTSLHRLEVVPSIERCGWCLAPWNTVAILSFPFDTKFSLYVRM